MASSTHIGFYGNTAGLPGFEGDFLNPASLNEVAKFVRVHAGAFNPDSVAFRDVLKAIDPSVLTVMYVLGTGSEDWAAVPRPRALRSGWSYKGGTQGEPDDWAVLDANEDWFIHCKTAAQLAAQGSPAPIDGSGPRLKSLTFAEDHQLHFGYAGYRAWVFNNVSDSPHFNNQDHVSLPFRGGF